MATNIGPRIGVDGEAEYRKQMANIVAQAKALDSEMKALSASFGKSATAQEKNSATSKILTQQIEVQKKALSELQGMYDKAVSKYGEGSTEALKYKNEVNKVTAELNRLKNQLSDTENGLDDMDNELEDVSDSLDDAGQGAVSFGDLIKANVIGDAIINGVKKLASAAKDMAGDFISAAADMKAQTAQFEQTFGDLKEKATQNLEEIGETAGILPNRMRSAYTQLYAYAKSSGMESAAALEFATKATYAAADAAAYYDRSLEEATEQVLAYTKGNFANDAALGFASTAATRNAQAIKSLGKEYKDLDATAGETTQVLLDQILASQKLSGAAGQASREMDGWENVTGNLSEAWKEFQATAGDPFLENLIPLIKKGTQYLTSLEKSIDWDSFSKKVEKAFGKIEIFAKGAIDFGKKVLPVVGNGLEFVGKNFQTLASVAVGAYTAIKVFQGIHSVTKVVTGFQKALQTSTTAMSAAQKGMQLLNLTMSANVFGAVAIAAAALVAGIAALVAMEKQAKTAAEEEAEASKKVAQASKERLEAYQEQMNASEQQAIADTEQIAYTQQLWNELKRLADETGKVEEKDQTRAQFILGELNTALGTEYEMTGNQIQNYRDMADAVDNLIEKKRAQILLDSKEAAYQEAITKRTALAQEQVKIYGELSEAEKELSQRKEELSAVYEKINEQARSGALELDEALRIQAQSLQGEVAALKENLEAKQSAYDNNETLLRTYYANIATYEQGATAILEGETQKAIDLLDNTNHTLVLGNELLNKSHAEQIEILKQQNDDAQKAFELTLQRYSDGVAGITTETLLEAKRTADEANKIYADAIGRYAEDTTTELEKETEETRILLDEQNKGFIQASDLLEKTQTEQKEILKTQAEDAFAYFQKLSGYYNEGVGNVTEQMVLDAFQMAQQAKEEYIKVGGDMVTGTVEGVNAKKEELNESIQNLMNVSIEMARKAIDAHSPSRRFEREVGETIPTGIAGGIDKNVEILNSSVRSMMDDSVDQLKNVGSDAFTWGEDMIQGFTNGINNMASGLISTVKSIAGQVADFLGFSVPKKGPLSDADEYGPDFMELFAKGIHSKSYLVQNAIGRVASGIDLPSSIMNNVPVGSLRGNNTTNLGGINIQVYGAQGQDVNALADIIMYKTQSALERREAVFG